MCALPGEHPKPAIVMIAGCGAEWTAGGRIKWTFRAAPD